MHWRFAQPGVRLAPSLLAADFLRLSDAIDALHRADVEWLHLDVMDGHFVPNLSFGIPVIAALRPTTRMFLDAHLMIDEPMRYAETFIRAGCDHVTVHIESFTPQPRRVADSPHGAGRAILPGDVESACRKALDCARIIHEAGASAGVCINPATPVDAITPLLTEIEMVLVMSVWPGFGGQKFMPGVLGKVETLRAKLRPDQRLQIDGGIDARTIGDAVRAGADTLVAGSAVFNTGDATRACRDLLIQANKPAEHQP